MLDLASKLFREVGRIFYHFIQNFSFKLTVFGMCISNRVPGVAVLSIVLFMAEILIKSEKFVVLFEEN